MTTTHRLSLPLLEAAQAQKHITHNEALLDLETFVAPNLASRAILTPPVSPANGALYLIDGTGAGAWAAKDGQIAVWRDGAWVYQNPVAGIVAHVADEGTHIAYDGTTWSDLGARISIDQIAKIGINTSANTTNRLSVSTPAMLVTAESDDVQVKVNKQASADTASVLFQTGFSGRAEFGLTGDDNWHVKVSADGTSWSEALVADAATGRVDLPEGFSAPVVLASFTTAQLPAATGNAAALAYCTDASGGGCPVFSDGTNWRTVTDRSVVA
ncbi:MAG: DUF2793 domain-containing protein [Pseudomonadota bacterium]